MGGRGSGGSRNSGGAVKTEVTVDREIMDSYMTTKLEKEMMSDAVSDVEDSINKIMDYPYMDKDTDNIYEALADYYPRSMAEDDAEKALSIRNAHVTTVNIRLNDNWKTGKIEIRLTPHSYSYDEFSDSELRDFGVERR